MTLQGRRVLVGRTRESASGLVDALHKAGAEAVVVPLIATVPLAPPDVVRAAIARLQSAAGRRWLLFTSATAVRLVAGALGADPGSGLLIGAVGASTEAALREAGWPVDARPAGEQSGGGLAAELIARGVDGATVLLAVAEAAHDTLPRRLEAAGATVQRLVVYRTEMPAEAPRRLAAALSGPLDAVLLTSGSTARNLMTALGGRRLDPATGVVCIGAQTADDARSAGLTVDAIAAEPSVAALLAAAEALMPPRQPVP